MNSQDHEADQPKIKMAEVIHLRDRVKDLEEGKALQDLRVCLLREARSRASLGASLDEVVAEAERMFAYVTTGKLPPPALNREPCSV